ncbi:hypothetical protein [Neorhizobium alkalisoli]|uniref:DNA-binding SARP family transcriptional activator n=1 Tax=Neorhizobium alkalisoli TaxID=528178 RepID=A0A561Q0Y1_9HYPH|nr:hypothetical protein [Neorhizobium alkalisoli]TWF44024.1 DNA-binding SARP family transcriptional activator [Neorhizobium alkalisoli]
MRYVLTTLGGGDLSDGNENSIRVPALSLVMCAYLFDAGRSVARRDLAQLLWPGNPDAALTNLRSTLLRTNTVAAAHGVPLLIDQSSAVALNVEAVSCDLEIITQPAGIARLRALNDAVSRKFFPAYGDRRDAIGQWVRDMRARLAQELRCEFLRNKATDVAGARAEIKRAAVLLLEWDPNDEDVRLALAQGSFQGMGSHTGNVWPRPREADRFASSISLEQPGQALPRQAPPRIALLPPEPLETVDKSGSVANALIEDLTISLCVDRTVSVVAPYTAAKIRNADNKAALLEQHDVIYALDTKMSGDSLFVQLIFMPRDEIVWAKRFQLEEEKIVAGRNAMAEAIQSSIIQKVGMLAPLDTDFRQKPRAYLSYLGGLRSLSHTTLPNVRKARRLFTEALEHDRGFAAALAGVSRTLTLEWVLTAQGDGELLARAERTALKAISEDSRFAGGFKELGVTQLYMGKIDDSLSALAEAEQASPHYADVLSSHADSLNHAGKPKEALGKAMAALALNPIAPDTYFWTAAGASFFLGEYQRALAYLDRMDDSRPASRLAAACWSLLGDTPKAKNSRLRVLSENPGFDLERWLSMVPLKEKWQIELYREGLRKAGF